MSEHYIVKDRLRDIEFNGTYLGYGTSEKDDSLRWTEIHIYRTDGGSYIVETLGKSVVYHRGGSSCDTAQCIRVRGKQLSDESEPCDRCNPLVPEDAGFNPDEVFLHERTISSIQVVKEVNRLHDALSSYDRQRRITKLSPVAHMALQSASTRDPKILNEILRTVQVP